LKDAFNNQRGSVTVIVLGAMLVLIILGMALLNLTVAEAIIVQNVADSSQAYYLAEAGLEMAISALKSNPNWIPDNKYIVNLQGEKSGEYKLILTRNGSEVRVESEGQVKSAKENVEATLRYTSFFGGDSPFNPFQYAMSWVNNEPSLKGNVNIIGGTKKTQQDQFANLNRIYKYFKDLSSHEGHNLSNNNNNLEGNLYYSGNVAIRGTTNFNGILVVDGNVTISGNFNPKGVIYSKGDIRLSGSFVTKGEVLLIAEGSIILVGNNLQDVYMISGNIVTLTGNTYIEGSIFSFNAPTGNGNITIKQKNPDDVAHSLVEGSLEIISRK
jgi:cytoskeletal protein CcmA (bactofilin family)